jgi:hypothetical protein
VVNPARASWFSAAFLAVVTSPRLASALLRPAHFPSIQRTLRLWRLQGIARDSPEAYTPAKIFVALDGNRAI